MVTPRLPVRGRPGGLRENTIAGLIPMPGTETNRAFGPFFRSAMFERYEDTVNRSTHRPLRAKAGTCATVIPEFDPVRLTRDVSTEGSDLAKDTRARWSESTGRARLMPLRSRTCPAAPRS